MTRPRVKPIPFETEQALRECLFYDPETGVFIWLKTIHSHAVIGSYAGSVHKSGYRVIQFQKRLFRANRLAFFFVKGEWPTGVIDHIDCDKSNDRFKNLRDVTHSVNMRNQHKAHKGNTSGYIGVSLHKATNKWIAQLNYKDLKKKHIGLFSTPEDAYAAYLAAKIDYEQHRRQLNVAHHQTNS